MNDGGYGVIKNIADAYYGGRRAYVDILGPDWGLMCERLPRYSALEGRYRRGYFRGSEERV